LEKWQNTDNQVHAQAKGNSRIPGEAVLNLGFMLLEKAEGSESLSPQKGRRMSMIYPILRPHVRPFLWAHPVHEVGRLPALLEDPGIRESQGLKRITLIVPGCIALWSGSPGGYASIGT